MAVQLVEPASEHLPSFVDALRRRWSPNTTRPEASDEELAAVEADPVAFLAGMDDRAGNLPDLVLADGTTRRRIPGFRLWIWDGAFCGSINARWVPGTVELPPHVLGHVGYSIVPWKRRRGYATEALRLMLPHLASTGLPYVELTTDDDNVGSQRVIEANGGRLVERFVHRDAGPVQPMHRYRIELGPASGPTGPVGGTA